ncbi:hypothetical protein ABVT39_017280 [Epinephelus coioides]
MRGSTVRRRHDRVVNESEKIRAGEMREVEEVIERGEDTGEADAGSKMSQYQAPVVFNQVIPDAIKQLKFELLSHFDPIMDNTQTSLDTMNGKLSILGDQVAELEQRVSSNQDNILALEKRETQMIDQENYPSATLGEVEHRVLLRDVLWNL